MRKDMHKVLTERPRIEGGIKEKTFDRKNRVRDRRVYHDVEEDFSPKVESTRKRHRVNFGGKEFSDFLSPLRRYLSSQVGRPWDKVWSDVCKVLKGNGLQANHVKGHIRSEVGGIPHSGETDFRPEDWHRARFPGRLYVDEHGILRKSPERSRKRTSRKYHYRKESDAVEYYFWKGSWFRVEIGRCYFKPRYIMYYEVKNKRQLSRKEIRDLKLDNHFETLPPKIKLE